MTSPYHPGELAVQSQAGVQAEALKLENAISTIIQPAAQAFLQTQRLAIAATVDADGKVWASLLIGKPGFLQALTQQVMQINDVETSVALINNNLQQQPDIGILVIDFATRRRLRLNGKAQIQPDGSINVQTQQVYLNCPKYIQLRYLEAEQLAPASASNANTLNLNQQRWHE